MVASMQQLSAELEAPLVPAASSGSVTKTPLKRVSCPTCATGSTAQQHQHQQQQPSAGAAAPGVLQLRHGCAEEQGRRMRQEDAHVAAVPLSADTPGHSSGLFAVFDGHNGPHAAHFAAERILAGICGSQHFPADIGAAMAEAFVAIDQQYYAQLARPDDSAGTTALAAVLWAGTLFLANAGDSRAVLSRRGHAIELTRDHKPAEPGEARRIATSGGYVCEQGLLCGQLGVARALGDFHLPALKAAPPQQLQDNSISSGGGAAAAAAAGAAGGAGGGRLAAPAASACRGPLTPEPELSQHVLSLAEGDEFMLLGCDGLWDVFPSQRAVEFARGRLRDHNDPQRCAEELVAEALRMHSSDNVTVLVVCFGPEPPKRRVYGCSRFGRSVSQGAALGVVAALLVATDNDTGAGHQQQQQQQQPSVPEQQQQPLQKEQDGQVCVVAPLVMPPSRP